MNQNKTLKAIQTLVVMFITGLTVSAQENTLSIQPVSFNDHEVHKLQIDFAKVNDVLGMQFDVVLPDFLEVAGNIEKNESRFNSNQTVNFKNGRVLVVTFGQEGIKGEFGPLLYIPVKVKDNVTETQEGEIKLNHCLFSGYAGVNMGGLENVSIHTSFSPYNVVFSPVDENVVINAGSSNSIGVSITNDCPILAFQAYVTVPEGFTLAPNAELSNRCPSDASLIVTSNGNNEYTLVYFCLSNESITGNSGEVFNIQVTAPAEYNAESAQIVFSEVEASYADGKYVVCNDFSFYVANHAPLYTALQQSVEGLREALLAARTAINENCPNVKDNFTGDDIESAIDALVEEINAKYSDGTLPENKEAFETQINTLSEQITALEAAAREAEAQFLEDQRNAATAAAYKATTDALAALQAQLNAVKEDVAKNYPAANVEEQVSAAQTAIDNVATAAKDAFDAVATEGIYEYTFDSEAIEALIAAVTAEAKAQQTEADRKAANEAAYKATTEALAALQAELAAAKEDAAQNYPAANVETSVAAAQKAIDDAAAAAKAAYDAVANEGTYEYTLDSEAIEALIAAVTADAKAQQAEVDRTGANQTAYDAVVAKLDALQQSLDAVKASIPEKYGEVDVTAETDAAQAAIDAARAAAKKAFEDVATEGVFEYEVPEADINALIDAISVKAAELAEANRKAANEAAYQASISQLDQLQAELNTAIENASANCPHANVIGQINSAQTAITNARSDASLAYLAVANSGVYGYVVDEAAIRALIEAVNTEAEAQEAAWAEAQRKAANDAAYQASLEEIAALQAQFDAAKAKIAAEDPDVDVTEQATAIQEAIDNARSAADQAYADVATEGLYEYAVPASEIEALIADMLKYAEENGITSIFADQIPSDTRIYTLSGVRVTRPVVGVVNILVSNDGKITKAIVR